MNKNRHKESIFSSKAQKMEILTRRILDVMRQDKVSKERGFFASPPDKNYNSLSKLEP